MSILFFLLPLAGFLLGSIPFGLYISRARGINIREHGSGNIGATNVFRVVGAGPGLLCFLLDVLKGAIPVLLAVNILGVMGKDPLTQWDFLASWRTMFPVEQRTLVQAIHVITGLAAVLGHNYSPWAGFKGGKGIATTAGVLFALMPVATCILLVVWAVLTFTTRYVVVGSVGAALALPLIVLWGAHHHKVDDSDPASLSLWESGTYNKPLLIFAIVASALAVYKHKANLVRLVNGTENRFGKKKG